MIGSGSMKKTQYILLFVRGIMLHILEITNGMLAENIARMIMRIDYMIAFDNNIHEKDD